MVAWEANDEPLKEAFRKHAAGTGPKVHCVNAQDIFGPKAGSGSDEIQPYYGRAKAGVHLTNYAGKAVTCAAALKISTHEAAQFQARWFHLHPNIAKWHEQTQHNLNTTKSVRNAFGFVRTYFERPDGLLPQALAWIPQSSVAIIIDTAYNRIVRTIPHTHVLLQVHDSLVGQTKVEHWQEVKPRLRKALEVIVPYDDPLIIPTGLKTSRRSWGDCRKESWGES